MSGFTFGVGGHILKEHDAMTNMDPNLTPENESALASVPPRTTGSTASVGAVGITSGNVEPILETDDELPIDGVVVTPHSEELPDAYDSSRDGRPSQNSFEFISNRDALDEFFQPLPKRRQESPHLRIDTFEHHIDQLTSHNIMLVASESQELLDLVDSDISLRFPDDDFHKFQFLHPGETQDGFGFRDIVQWHHRHGNKKLISFVRMRDRIMLNGLLKTLTDSSFKYHKALFQERSHFIVCQVGPELLDFELPKTSVEVDPQSDMVHIWRLHFLSPLITYYAKGSQDTDSRVLLERIAQQRKNWPMDNVEFCKAVSQILRDGGYKKLVEEVERKKTASIVDKADNMPDARKADVVQRAILFTTSFFPKLSPQDFEILMKVILHGEKYHYKTTTTVTEKSGNDVKTITSEVDHTMEAIDLWDEKGDELLRECGVKTIRDAGRWRNFDPPEIGQQISDVFSAEMDRYRMRQFEKIYRSGLLFMPETSDDLANKLVRLSATMASDNPRQFGHGWLWETVVAIENWDPEIRVSLGDLQNEHVMIQKFLEYLSQKHGKTSFFYERLANLCFELMSHSNTRASVEEFFRRLVHGGEATVPIARRLVSRLRDAPGFDYFEQLRQILRMAQSPIRLSLQRALLAEALQGVVGFASVASQLKKWHPQTDADRPLLNDENYSLSFLFDYVKAAHKLESDATRYHPFFDGKLKESEVEQMQRVEMIADWLVHPKLKKGVWYVFRDWKRETSGARLFESLYGARPRNEASPTQFAQIRNADLIADVLERSLAIAEELDDDMAIRGCHALIGQVNHRLRKLAESDKDLVAELSVVLREKHEAYLKEFAGYPFGEEYRLRREQLAAAKERVWKLYELFN